MSGRDSRLLGRWGEDLTAEYLRDKGLGRPIEVPANYYPEDDDTRPPRVSWRSSANLLYSNWLNYFVYQTTPFDLSELQAKDSE